MNLLLLVEGEKTEPKIYKAWLSYLFPQLVFVNKPEAIGKNSCRIVIGYGYPNMVSSSKLYGISRLEAYLLDIKNYNNVDHFFICVDSEEETYQDRFNEINSKLEHFKAKLGMDHNQKTKFHIIIQHCCIETWALGNLDLPLQYPRNHSSQEFSLFHEYYDILTHDPELMVGNPPGYTYATKAKFHERYLKEYLKEFGLVYRKKDPKTIAASIYLNSLEKRCSSTNHLLSLNYLLNIWKEMQILTIKPADKQTSDGS